MKQKKTERPVRVERDAEAVIREFILGVEEWKIPVDPVVLTNLYDLLGYKIAPNGARVWKNDEIKTTFGVPYAPADKFYADWQEITDAEIKDTTEPSSSESSESSKVR